MRGTKHNSVWEYNHTEHDRNDAIESIKDIKDLYYGFFQGSESLLSEIHKIGLLLSKVKLILSSENITEPNKRADFLLIVNQLLSEERVLAKEEKAKAPFSGVPSPERSLLDDLREITGAKENQFIQDKLGELASAIKNPTTFISGTRFLRIRKRSFVIFSTS